MAEEDKSSKKVADGMKKASDKVEEFASRLGRAGEATKNYTGSIESAAQSTVELLTLPWKKMAQLIGTNTDAFEKLNQSGMSFGNSMNNIRMSAAEMRMSLDDFTKLMGESQKSFASLGGTATKSAENFTKLGKEMQQSGLAEKMTQMGFGYQELNEILAIQIGASKEKMGADEASRRKTIESAMALAEEMDGLAKLTGMSRKDQEESRKALQRDMQLEAALRLQTRNMSADDAKAYRANMMNIIETTKAERGEAAASAAKELITTGTLKSSEAQASASLDADAFQAMQRQIASGKKGDIAGMNQAREEARQASMRNQDNEAYLTVASQVGGVAGKVTTGQMASMQTQYEGTKALDEENRRNGITKDLNGLMEQQKKLIKEEQTARDGLTAGMIATRNNLADANAAAVRRTGEVMGKDSNLAKQVGKIAEDRAGGGKQAEYGKLIEKNTPVGDLMQFGSDVGAKAVEGLRDVTAKLRDLVEEINKTYGNVKNQRESNKKAGSRDGGTLEKTGSPIEPMDALVKIHKGETVLSPEATKDMAKQLSNSTKRNDNLTDAVGQLSQTMPGSIPGIDINKILSDVTTTVSKAETAPVQTQPAVKDNALDAVAQAKEVQDQISKLREEESKKELETRQDSVAQTTKFAEEQMKITQKSNEKQLDYNNSVILNTMGLNNRQKEMHGELAKLTISDSEAKLEANKKQLAANLNELKALDAKANAIEETAKKEGRALTESEQAQIDAIDKESQEKMKANGKVNARMADENKVLEKLIEQKTFAEKNGLEIGIAENNKLVKVVENNSVKIAEDMKEALPVKDLSESTAQVGDVYQQLGETTLKYARQNTEEQIATYKEGAETSLEANKNQITENNERLLELQKTANERELTTAEKHRMEALTEENKKLEDENKYRQAEIEAYTQAENEKKGIVTKSAEAQIAATEKVSTDVKQELSGIMENVGDNFDQVMTKSVDEFGSNFDEVVGGQLLENMNVGEKSADNSAEKIAADIKNALPTSDVDLEKMGGDMLANMGKDAKYSETKEDPTERIKSDMLKESMGSAKTTKFSDISLDANGMPVVKSKSKDLVKKEEPKQSTPTPSPGKKINPETGQEYTPVDESQPSKTGKEGNKEQKSTLDDVVKKLELLNTTMNTLIKKTEEAAANQVKATKGIASGNLFGAH